MSTATHIDKVRAERIKQIRLNLGLLQKELAAKLGVDPITVSRWERGDKKPNELNRFKLARLAGVHPNFLRDVEDEAA